MLKPNTDAPSYDDHREIDGFWCGASYLTSKPVPVFNLTWGFLWALFKLRLCSPRRNDFKLGIMDYGYVTQRRGK